MASAYDFVLDQDVAQERYTLTERGGPPAGEAPWGRELQHVRKPYVARTAIAGPREEQAMRLALAYLREPQVAAFFAYDPRLLDHLERRVGAADWDFPDRDPDGRGLRWVAPVVVRRRPRDGEAETIAVCVQETFRPPAFAVETVGGRPVVPDVWGGGLRVVVQFDPPRVTSAGSTLVHDVEVAGTPTGRGGEPDEHGIRAGHAVSRSDQLGARIARLNGVDPDRVRLGSTPDFELFIYRFSRGDLRDAPSALTGDEGFPTGEQNDSIVRRVQYAVRQDPDDPHEETVYRALIRLSDGRVLYQRLLGTNAVQGSIFTADPVSQAGLHVCHGRGSDAALPPLPHDYCSCLNAWRSRVPLARLEATDLRGRQHLRGDFVAIADPNPLDIPPPALPFPHDFSFEARSSDFAAVNAYHHGDRAIELVRAMGFALDEYFAPGQFPLRIVHRGGIVPTPCRDGLCINAQVIADHEPDSRRVSEIRFALGDLTDVANPLGVAADPRWIWHEFGHVLLQAGTGEMEFPFCHSAGDGLAAILSDPDSVLADEALHPPDPLAKPDGPERGITFPFVYQPLRRHDRSPKAGWGWFGAMHRPGSEPDERDPGGYRAEEIMSSTLFRLYRAIGGDAVSGAAPDAARRSAAAYRAAYLIVRAIGSLGPARTVPAARAGIVATALMDADAGTQSWPGGPAGIDRPGGTLHKVIRWAFEQQGLYPPADAAWPVNDVGAPPEVDVHLDDGEGGYGFREAWATPATALWVRRSAGSGADEAPAPGTTNWVYVKVANRGRAAASGVSVSVHAAAGPDVDAWSSAWTAVPRQAGGHFPQTIAAGGSEVFGPFLWDPPPAGHAALLAAATALGDRHNLDPATQLPCALAASVPIAEVVPYDNNLGYRRWTL